MGLSPINQSSEDEDCASRGSKWKRFCAQLRLLYNLSLRPSVGKRVRSEFLNGLHHPFSTSSNATQSRAQMTRVVIRFEHVFFGMSIHLITVLAESPESMRVRMLWVVKSCWPMQCRYGSFCSLLVVYMWSAFGTASCWQPASKPDSMFWYEHGISVLHVAVVHGVGRISPATAQSWAVGPEFSLWRCFLLPICSLPFEDGNLIMR